MDEDARTRRADAARNRERVLASAEAVLARDGLTASMRAIAAHAGVGLGTIYRNFPTQQALYQAIIVQRTRALVAEATELAGAPDPGQAFFGYFTRVVEHAMRTKAIADLLARAGIDPKSGLAGIGDDMRHAVGILLGRAQQAGAVRPDLRMPELMAILTAACMAAEHSQWDAPLRTRTLAVVFDGMRPQHRPTEPGGPRGGPGQEPGPLPRRKAHGERPRRRFTGIPPAPRAAAGTVLIRSLTGEPGLARLPGGGG